MNTKITRDTAAGGGPEDTAELPALQLGPPGEAGMLERTDSWASTDSWKLGPEQQRELDREAELGTLRSNLASMAESRGYLENSLRSLTMSLRDLEESLVRKTGQMTDMERDVRARDALLAARDGELRQLQTSLESEQQRGNAVQQALSALELGHGELRAQHDSMLAGANDLRNDLRDQLETIRSLQEQLEQARRDKEQTLTDLKIAEERIRAADVQLHSRDARIVKLGVAETELKARAEDLARRLAERDDLIQRLENEADSSAAVLGKIQSNLARFDRDESSLPRDLVARLLVRSDGNTEIVQVLGRRTLIGRGVDCQLQIDAEFVSRRHALLLVSPEETVIEDLNSTNGVFVNGARVSRRKLAEGDNITIGKTLFRYVLRPVAERGN